MQARPPPAPRRPPHSEQPSARRPRVRRLARTHPSARHPGRLPPTGWEVAGWASAIPLATAVRCAALVHHRRGNRRHPRCRSRRYPRRSRRPMRPRGRPWFHVKHPPSAPRVVPRCPGMRPPRKRAPRQRFHVKPRHRSLPRRTLKTLLPPHATSAGSQPNRNRSPSHVLQHCSISAASTLRHRLFVSRQAADRCGHQHRPPREVGIGHDGRSDITPRDKSEPRRPADAQWDTTRCAMINRHPTGPDQARRRSAHHREQDVAGAVPAGPIAIGGGMVIRVYVGSSAPGEPRKCFT